jgi:hypothetical protein
MRDYFMVSECDGDLFDTRKPNWHKMPALRPAYGLIKCDVESNNTALKAAIRTKYAWPGGYELFGICNDGAAMCCDCMRREYYLIAYSRRHKINDGWRVVAIDCAVNYDSYIYCEHCNKTIVEDWQETEEADN